MPVLFFAFLLFSFLYLFHFLAFSRRFVRCFHSIVNLRSARLSVLLRSWLPARKPQQET